MNYLGQTISPVQHDPNIRLEHVAKLGLLESRPCARTLNRWRYRGVVVNGKRIRLRWVRDGRHVCTRRSWLEEFNEARTRAEEEAWVEPAPVLAIRGHAEATARALAVGF